jgi:hypothetical protein
MRAPVIPLELFPGDWCLMCIDPQHPDKKCHMLEMQARADGSVAIEPCGCENSITAGRPGQYVVKVTQVRWLSR